MPERHTYGDPQDRAETVAPQNPPNSVVEPDIQDAPKSAAGVVGMWYILGPLILFLVVLGIGLFFWADDADVDPDESPAIGTIGEGANEQTPGGGDPDAPSGGTASEIEQKGGRGN
jgi:hypothetical protein